MLNRAALHDLRHELADTNVLSVYLDARVTDPAMRHVWRPVLQNTIRDVRSRLHDEEERAAFDRAATFLHDPDPSPAGTWGAPGWVAFVTADGPCYVANLPVHPGTLAAWRQGPVVAPYLRALKQQRPVIVALVESGAARIYRYAEGAIERLDELIAPEEDSSRDGRPTAPRMHGGAAPAARGAVGADVANRRRLAAFQRLAASLGERLVQVAGHDGWVLIGGTHEWARLAGEALPRSLAGRVLVSATLDHDASANAIKVAAKQAATELRGAQGLALVNHLLDHGGGHARAAVGLLAVQRALQAHAVDLLLVSPGFIRAHEDAGEDAVRDAIAFGADVDVPSGEAAERLDGAAGGIAARLRFAIDTSEPAIEATAESTAGSTRASTPQRA